jgi:hypothetical protein
LASRLGVENPEVMTVLADNPFKCTSTIDGLLHQRPWKPLCEG